MFKLVYMNNIKIICTEAAANKCKNNNIINYEIVNKIKGNSLINGLTKTYDNGSIRFKAIKKFTPEILEETFFFVKCIKKFRNFKENYLLIINDNFNLDLLDNILILTKLNNKTESIYIFDGCYLLNKKFYDKFHKTYYLKKKYRFTKKSIELNYVINYVQNIDVYTINDLNKIISGININKFLKKKIYKKKLKNITEFMIKNKLFLHNYKKILLKYKIIAVIPVHGRNILLKYTIKRLYNNGLYKVICVGNSKTDKKTVMECGAEWVQHENDPLGKKWNTGFKYAEKYEPDGILFVGSSDWIDYHWIQYAENYLDDYGMIGKKDYYMADITNGTLRLCHWLGYNDNRKNEPIGIGRLLNKEFLKSINYKPFDDNKNSSMDYMMYNKCVNNNFKIKMIEDDYCFLSLSCDLWTNKHIFNDHYLGAQKKLKVENFPQITKKNAIELIKLYENTYNISMNDYKFKYIFKHFKEIYMFYIEYIISNIY